MNQKPYTKPIIAFFVFLICQVVASIVIILPFTVINSIKNGGISSNMPSTMISTSITIALLVSSILSIVAMIWPLKMFDFRNSFGTKGLKDAFWIIPLGFVGCMSTNVINEAFALDNLLGTEFFDMAKSALGIIAIAIVGPIAEEICMRGSIQSWMHKHGVSPLKSILIASLLFGIMHMNPAQIPFAMLVGIILGLLYWKSQSLLLPCILHVVNNSFACLTMIMADPDAEPERLSDYLGGTFLALTMAIIVLSACIWILIYKWNPAKTSDTEDQCYQQ